MQHIEITKACLPESPPVRGFLKVGNHVIDCGALRVISKAPMCSLPPKSILVLYELAKNAGDTVSRDALMVTVWPEKITPASDVVKQAIMGLRRTFDTQSSSQSLIETIPKTGYRLLAGCRYAEDLAELNEMERARAKKEKIRQASTRQPHAEKIVENVMPEEKVILSDVNFMKIDIVKASFKIIFIISAAVLFAQR
jgi:DNA-binding winged helix-turn-helix (wHTH) protein